MAATNTADRVVRRFDACDGGGSVWARYGELGPALEKIEAHNAALSEYQATALWFVAETLLVVPSGEDTAAWGTFVRVGA